MTDTSVNAATALKAKWQESKRTFVVPVVIFGSLAHFVNFHAAFVYLLALGACKAAPLFLTGEGLRNIVPSTLKALWKAVPVATGDYRVAFFIAVVAAGISLVSWLFADPVFVYGAVVGVVASVMFNDDDLDPVWAVIGAVLGTVVCYFLSCVFLEMFGFFKATGAYWGAYVQFPSWWPVTCLLSGVIGLVTTLPFAPDVLEFVTNLFGYEVERVTFGDYELRLAGSPEATPAE